MNEQQKLPITPDNTDILLAVVLDQSGSMNSVAQETVNGFNNLIKEQKEMEGTAHVSLTLFDTKVSVKHVATPINDLPPLTLTPGPDQYNPGGMTALYDAFCTTIRGVAKWRENNPDAPERTLLVVLTDGGENSSKEWKLDDVNNLIKEKRSEGWEFAFMGGGGSAWLEGQNFALPAQSNFAYNGDKASTQAAWGTASSSIAAYRSAALGKEFAFVQDADDPEDLIQS